MKSLRTSAIKRRASLFWQAPLATKISVAVLISAVLVFLWWMASEVTSSLTHFFEDREIEQLNQKAGEAENKAAAHVNEAREIAVKRAAEDFNRARQIVPEIERTSRNLAETRERTRKAQINYEKALQPPTPVDDPDITVLHDWNCADLAELYPGEQHPICNR